MPAACLVAANNLADALLQGFSENETAGAVSKCHTENQVICRDDPFFVQKNGFPGNQSIRYYRVEI